MSCFRNQIWFHPILKFSCQSFSSELSPEPKLTHHTHVLDFAMATDRGAEDKMLEKTELLKLSVTELKTGRVQFPTTLTFRAS